MNYRNLFSISRLWLIFVVFMVIMFGVLLAVGGHTFREAPPHPDKVILAGTSPPEMVFSGDDIHRGRDVWRRLGGMELGSVWGHGAYLAPDWTADVLHREAYAMLNWDGSYENLSEAEQAARQARLAVSFRTNTYDLDTKTITISSERKHAIDGLVAHYSGLLGGDGDSAEYESLREAYGIPNEPLGNVSQSDIRSITAWWWWTAWAAGTFRPGTEVTYTSNWPHEPLIDNKPSPEAFLWTIISIVLLIMGVGLLCWFFLREREEWQQDLTPESGFGDSNPLIGIIPTPSMRAVKKYIWVVAALILLQIVLGAITAHYAIEGHDFYGFPLSEFLPYALTRTWHVQLAVLWIATAWLGAGLYLAPLILRREPRLQAFGANFLWLALIIAVIGSLVGEWATITGRMTDPTVVYWFGHQGYEFLDMGRFWQLLIFVGLLLWLGLMARCVIPTIQENRPDKHLVLLLFVSSAGIGLLFGAGLFYDRASHLTVVEYWRWWVVHLWVEGIFEVFATAWVAWIFVHMRLLRASTAAVYVMFSAMIFLGGGVLGTFHHLYFAGTPQSVLALGSVFSALEVVPLALIAFDAHDHWRAESYAPWVKRYRLPLMFFLAVAFWNLVGAGVLGFLINPPLSLYYLQGLLTTPAHGHAALFGVYGMLGIGFLLLCRRDLLGRFDTWSDQLFTWVFWLFNIGLALMVFGSLLPQGLVQAYTSFSEGYWHARTAEFMHTPLMEFLVWLRVPGDIVFAGGALLLVWGIFRLDIGWLNFGKQDSEPED